MLEEGEVFDSSLLRETINSLIASGKRNFAVDLSSLEYIYSDTINVLMAMNKRILDVSGRLSLLGPRPEVVQILKRAGIHNILKVFDSEADLIKSSEDIILQTTSFKVADVKAAIAEELEPQSEFDQLRNEIGSVFGGSESGEAPKAPAKKVARPKARPPVEQPIVENPVEEERYIQDVPQNASPTPSVAPSIEQEFDQVFQNFEEAPVDESTNFAAPPVEPVRPQPQFAPPPRQGRPGFVPPQQQPQYQAKQFTPPPPPRPVVPPSPRPVMPPPPMQRPPRAPAAPQMRSPEPPQIQPKAYPVQEPSSTPEFTVQRPETQLFPNAPAAPSKPSRKQEPVIPEEFEEDLEEFAAPKKKVQPVEENTFEDEDLDDDFEAKKHSPVPIIALVIVLVILGGAGIFFAISKFSKKPEIASPASTTAMQQNTPAQQPAVPQLPVETQPAQTQPAATPEKASVPTQTTQNEEVVQKKAPKPVVEKKSVRTKPAAVPKAPARETEAEAVPSTPSASQAPTTPAKLIITSTPSGAGVSINGEELGYTPYTWTKPVFGSINVVVSKQGYKESSKSFEFTGGTQKQAFTLEKEVVAPPPPPPPPPQRVVAKPEPTPEPSSTDDFADEPAPSVSPTPVSTAPAAVSSAGGDASIFIASIPPVADVYLNGKLIGKTNVSELKLPSGTHTLRFVKGPKEITKDITVQSGKNPSQMVRIP